MTPEEAFSVVAQACAAYLNRLDEPEFVRTLSQYALDQALRILRPQGDDEPEAPQGDDDPEAQPDNEPRGPQPRPNDELAALASVP